MKCGEFVGELFRARDIAHIEHLQSNLMAEHVVLEELYDALLDHVDNIAEMRLARGKMPITIKHIPENVNMVEYLEGTLLPMIDKAKEKMDSKGFNDIGAEVDMVKTTVMKKLYKLKNLIPKKGEDVPDDGITEYKHNGGVLYSKFNKVIKRRPPLVKR